MKSEIRNPKSEKARPQPTAGSAAKLSPKLSGRTSRCSCHLRIQVFGFLRTSGIGLRISVAFGAVLLVVALLFPTFTFAADSVSLDTCRQLGKACYENDDFTSAAGHFRRAIALAPDSATDYFNLGLVLMRATDYTNALAALDKAEQLDPKLLGAQYIRGIVFKRQGEFPKAIENLKRVVAGDSQCVGAYYNLAMCYKSTEQYSNAIATLNAALEREPNTPVVTTS